MRVVGTRPQGQPVNQISPSVLRDTRDRNPVLTGPLSTAWLVCLLSSSPLARCRVNSSPGKLIATVSKSP